MVGSAVKLQLRCETLDPFQLSQAIRAELQAILRRHADRWTPGSAGSLLSCVRICFWQRLGVLC